MKQFQNCKAQLCCGGFTFSNFQTCAIKLNFWLDIRRNFFKFQFSKSAVATTSFFAISTGKLCFTFNLFITAYLACCVSEVLAFSNISGFLC